jgi:hypothetical protein
MSCKRITRSSARKSGNGAAAQNGKAKQHPAKSAKAFRVWLAPCYLKGVAFTGRPSKKFTNRPFFQFRLSDRIGTGLSNMAKCLDISHRRLFLLCWGELEKEMERRLGFNIYYAADLSQGEVKVIRERIKNLGRTFTMGAIHEDRN